MITSSPWGKVQTSTEIAPGIIQVTTGTHGGIHLQPWRIGQMPECLQPKPEHCEGDGSVWFEEDIDSSIVHLAFPEFFKGHEEGAERTLRNSYPNLWEPLYGRKLEVHESETLKDNAFADALKTNYVRFNTYRSASYYNPTGYVFVSAVKGSYSSGDITHWLVPVEREAEPRLVIDPAIDKQANQDGLFADPTLREAQLENLWLVFTKIKTTGMRIDTDFRHFPRFSYVEEVRLWFARMDIRFADRLHTTSV